MWVNERKYFYIFIHLLINPSNVSAGAITSIPTRFRKCLTYFHLLQITCHQGVVKSDNTTHLGIIYELKLKNGLN